VKEVEEVRCAGNAHLKFYCHIFSPITSGHNDCEGRRGTRRFRQPRPRFQAWGTHRAPPFRQGGV